ncbi:hypothetical protein DAE35_18710 [Salmonella enterica]|nr:hypothetical protein [Salmonella enterica]
MHIHDFSEVYHGQGISEASFSAAARRITARGITQYIEDNTVDRVAHIVVTELKAGWKGSKIRNWLFSDLTGKREKVYVCSVLYVLYVLFVFHVLRCIKLY